MLRRNNLRFLRTIHAVQQCHYHKKLGIFGLYSIQVAKNDLLNRKFQGSFPIFHPYSTTNLESDEPKPSASSAQSMEELPEVLQQQCQKWEKAVRAEQAAQNRENQWCNYKLRCVSCVPGISKDRMVLSIEMLPDEDKQNLLKIFQPGVSVHLRQFPERAWKEELSGVVNKHLIDRQRRIVVRINRKFTLKEEAQLKSSTFDVMINSDHRHEKQLEFLDTCSEWHAMPGYNAMLCAFKCKPLPSAEEMGPDPTEWIGEKEKGFFNTSQLEALSAALNPNRPIVAIHGGPGTGKTRLLVEYLQQLRKQNKRVLVLSSPAGLYNLVGSYYKETGDTNFHVFRPIDEQLARQIIPEVHYDLKKFFFSRLPNEHQSEKTRKFYGMVHTLEKEIDGAARRGKSKELLDEAKEILQQGIEETHELNHIDMKTYLMENNKIIFSTTSSTNNKYFTKNGINFDTIVFEDSNGTNELKVWWMALSMAPTLRLFGDHKQYEMLISSPEAHELGFETSLLERLDNEFGPEINFHLRRQYRSAPAIQQWLIRAFCGSKTTEPDESVRNIKLEDLLVPGAELIKDPLVLVDLGRLDGEWRDVMFESEECGSSMMNFGESLLVAMHLQKLFENLQPGLTHPSQIAYISTTHLAQHKLLKNIFELFSPSFLKQFEQIRTDNLQGQSVEVLLQSFVTTPPDDFFTEQYTLKRLASRMTRARRQYMLLAKSEWLEQGSDQSRLLLETFKEHGRIVGPNDLLQLKPGQFRKMQREMDKLQLERQKLSSRNI